MIGTWFANKRNQKYILLTKIECSRNKVDIKNHCLCFSMMQLKRSWDKRGFHRSSFNRQNSTVHNCNYRSSHPEVLCKKDILKNLAKFSEKHMCHNLILNKVAGLAKFLKTPFVTEPLGGFFPNSFSTQGEDNLVTFVVGSLTAWIGAVKINWPAQAKFLFQALQVNNLSCSLSIWLCPWLMNRKQRLRNSQKIYCTVPE